MVTVIKQGSTQEKIKELLIKLFEKKDAKGINAHKYCGVLKQEEDSLTIQKKLRDEWR